MQKMPRDQPLGVSLFLPQKLQCTLSRSEEAQILAVNTSGHIDIIMENHCSLIVSYRG